MVEELNLGNIIEEPLKVTGGLTYRMFKIVTDKGRYIVKLLNPNIINDEDVKEFVSEYYYDRFIVDRKNKDDFFTDRESVIIFGIPACLIEGILVGREYEKITYTIDILFLV